MNDAYTITVTRARLILFYAYLVAIGILALFVAKVVVDNHRIAAESHRALCTLRVERERRLDQSQEILRNPDDPDNALLLKTFGKAFILRSIATSTADVKALKDVSC